MYQTQWQLRKVFPKAAYWDQSYLQFTQVNQTVLLLSLKSPSCLLLKKLKREPRYNNLSLCIITYIAAALSAAAATAGSRWILQRLPCSCRNCVGSAFYNDNTLNIVLITNPARWSYYFFIKISPTFGPPSIIHQHTTNFSFLTPCLVPHYYY